MHNLPNLEKYREAAADPKAIALLLGNSIVQPSGCREWQKAVARSGYGVIHHKRRAMLAHRLAYWAFKGSITGLLVVDHMCQNRKCVEPSHLRLLTAAENMSLARTARKTHCRHGHRLTDDNVTVFTDRKGNPHRQCRTCAASHSLASGRRRSGVKRPTGTRRELAERNARILADLASGQDANQVGAIYGIHPTQVRKIKRDAA